MPLTEIDVTTPKPIYRNYWTDREAARAAAPPPPPWPAVDPGLLGAGRPKLPAFPLTVFPRQWREWVSDAAQWAGSSEDYVAQALLASVAGLCGQGVAARITEAWSEPVILWQALVGGPSCGKTPALEWLRRPLGTVERMRRKDFPMGRHSCTRQSPSSCDTSTLRTTQFGPPLRLSRRAD
jgi:Protein of unknown function (DUF3987)